MKLLFKIPLSDVRDLEPQATMLGGEWIFQK